MGQHDETASEDEDGISDDPVTILLMFELFPHCKIIEIGDGGWRNIIMRKILNGVVIQTSHNLLLKNKGKNTTINIKITEKVEWNPFKGTHFVTSSKRKKVEKEFC